LPIKINLLVAQDHLTFKIYRRQTSQTTSVRHLKMSHLCLFYS